MSDTKFVVPGEWKDQEWTDLAASYKSNVDATNGNSTETNRKYWAGPRIHPYGPLAITVVVDRQPRVYPTREAAIADGALDETNAE